MNEEREIIDSLRCDLSTGKVYWKKISKYHSEKNGKEAGCVTSDNRCYIKLNGKRWKRSHIVYFFANGRLPKNGVIDHINRNSLDDRPSNLREVDRATNARNHSRTNIRKVKTTGKYQVRLGKMQVGSFVTLEEAKTAYKEAREKIWKT